MCQKSAYRPDMERSQVYSNCRARQVADTSAPLPGKDSSTRAKIGRGSRTGKASKATARIREGGRPGATFGGVPRQAATLAPAAPVTSERNERRLGMRRGCARRRCRAIYDERMGAMRKRWTAP